jgi:hypothetical protein
LGPITFSSGPRRARVGTRRMILAFRSARSNGITLPTRPTYTAASLGRHRPSGTRNPYVGLHVYDACPPVHGPRPTRPATVLTMRSLVDDVLVVAAVAAVAVLLRLLLPR